jgi:SAM-dependent methyltransferase
MSATPSAYGGTELEVFQHAYRWKRYWGECLRPFVGNRVLDVGAGIGATAINLAAHHHERWVELEPDRELAASIVALRDAGKIPPQCEVVVGTTADLAVQDHFDTILFVDVLEHIEHDRAELVRVSSHLDAGGHIVVLAPAHGYLFSPFDTQIGHFRRYDRSSLIALTPPGCEVAAAFYLDSVGMLASLANRLLLKSGTPTPAQIRFWDRMMIPLSRIVDRLTRRRLGKTVVCVYRKSA